MGRFLVNGKSLWFWFGVYFPADSDRITKFILREYSTVKIFFMMLWIERSLPRAVTVVKQVRQIWNEED